MSPRAPVAMMQAGNERKFLHWVSLIILVNIVTPSAIFFAVNPPDFSYSLMRSLICMCFLIRMSWTGVCFMGLLSPYFIVNDAYPTHEVPGWTSYEVPYLRSVTDLALRCFAAVSTVATGP